MPTRSYRQQCALARTLDVIGDRWSMLIIRNLLLGPQRWSELRDALPAVAKNLLISRLRDLEAHNILRHQGEFYQLTPSGEDLQPALFALASWGDEHLAETPRQDEAFRLRYLMTSMRRKLQPTAVRGILQLHVDEDAFLIQLGPQPNVTQGAGPSEAQLDCTSEALRALLFTDTGLTALVTKGAVAWEGDRSVIDAWLTAWALARPQESPDDRAERLGRQPPR